MIDVFSQIHIFKINMGSCRLLLNSLCKQYSKLSLLESSCHSGNALKSNAIILHQPVFHNPLCNSWRFSHSFFSRISAEKLWKGVTSVSPAGRKKGRGRGSSKKVARDLNRGQVIGFGKKNMLWPGLNAPIVQGKEVLRQQELPPDESRQKRILELRDKFAGRRSNKVHPLERGWSGNKLPGRSLGAPDPVGDEMFEGFDSRVLEFKPVMHMTAQRGRARSMSAFVCVGNKKELAGFALTKAVNGNSAAKSAKNKAAKVLRYIELDNDTVVHDFFCQFGAVKVFVEKRQPGHGLVAHRVIRAICDCVGIKDLFAKIEGPARNYQNLTKAFFIGLMTQRSLKQIANEKGLHIVKMQAERDYFPVVVASPDRCRTEEEIPPTEVIDFTIHLHGGKIVEERKKFEPFYYKFDSYIKEMKDREKLRNHRDVRIHLLAKYDALKSFVQIREEEKAKQQVKDTIEQS